MKKTRGVFCACCVLAAFLGTACVGGKKPNKKLSIESRAALEKVLEINELQSLEYIYNSYVIDYDDSDRKRITEFEAFFARPFVTEANYESVKAIVAPVLTDSNHEPTAAYQELLDAFADHLGVEDLTVEIGNSSMVLSKRERVADLLFLLFLTDNGICGSYDDYKVHWEKLKADFSDSKKSSMTYAVAYRGTVRAGINEPIQFSVDDENAVVTVTIPQVKILDINIEPNEETMRFLYKKRKYKKGNIKSVLKLCEDDLRAKVAHNTAFLELAEQNVIETIQALCTPFEKTSAYTFVVTGAAQ